MENFGNHYGNVIYGMTDEQIETLQKQIAVYTYISELLIQSHKNLSSHQQLTHGSRMRTIYDPLLMNKISLRQRWTPSTPQIQALERIYATDTRVPNKERIKKITADLSEFGPISDRNVYNWFQNRRARSKRTNNSSVDAKSKVETKVNSKDKKIESNEFVVSLPVENFDYLNSQMDSDFLPYMNPKLDDLFAIL